jgi:Ca-activated chloride channel family protein
MATVSVAARFQPVAAETGEAVELAMQRLWLAGQVLPVGARLLVHHTFRSSEKKPLEVIYSFGLPRDAALRRFRVSGEGFSAHSELRLVEQALETYEQGIEAGRLSTLVRQYGDGLVNLTLGNIRAGEKVIVALEVLAGVEAHDDGLRFRFPFTLAPCYHPLAQAADVSDGFGEIELPEGEFGDLVLPRFAADATSLHEVGFNLRIRMPGGVREIGSPSHTLRVREAEGGARVTLATGSDVPDRDLVLDVRTRDGLESVLSGVDSQGRGRFAAVVPSRAFGRRSDAPRRVVFVLDRSGSMSGKPIEQARRAVEACLGALNPDDGFGLVAFDDQIEELDSALVPGTAEHREQARRFLGKLDARGGTELAKAITRATQILGGEGGELLVLTDGQVYGTEQILARARATGARIHCLGIGSASQDRFLALLARETGGLSRFLTPRERVDTTAVDMFASIGRPVASGLEVKLRGLPGGQIAPKPPATVLAGMPVMLFGETKGPAEGQLTLCWDGGTKSLPVSIGADTAGETLRLLQGARLITDLEGRWTGAGEGPAARREEQRMKRRLEALSRNYGLASRRMALVAVIERAGDLPGGLPKTEVVAVGMPQDTEFSAYFPPLARMARRTDLASSTAHFRLADAWPRTLRSLMRVTEQLAKEAADRLLELAAQIEPDGGMPGDSEEERVQATILALLAFLAEGHTEVSGIFRSHVRRLMEFLESKVHVHPVVARILALARRGVSLEGDWLARRPSPDLWAELEAADPRDHA